jgi:hypothetical protein
VSIEDRGWCWRRGGRGGLRAPEEGTGGTFAEAISKLMLQGLGSSTIHENNDNADQLCI